MSSNKRKKIAKNLYYDSDRKLYYVKFYYWHNVKKELVCKLTLKNFISNIFLSPF